MKINPPLIFLDISFISKYFNQIQTFRGNLVEYQTEINEIFFKQIYWFEINVLTTINLINSQYYDKIIEIRIEVNDIIRLHLLKNVQRIIIYHFHGKLLSFSSINKKNKIKKIVIYHKEKLNEYEINSLLHFCQRFNTISISLISSYFAEQLFYISNLKLFSYDIFNDENEKNIPNYFKSYSNSFEENQINNIEKQFDIFNDNSLWELCNIKMTQLILIINQNTINFLDLTCFEVLTHFQLNISSGKHLKLTLPNSLQSCSLNGNTLWVNNLKELSHLNSFYVNSNYGPLIKQQTKIKQKKICLPSSVESCFIKTMNYNARLGSLLDLNLLKQLNISGVVSSMDCSNNNSLTSLLINSSSPIITITFNSHLNYINITNKKGKILFKNFDVIKTIKCLSIDGDFDKLDLSNIISIKDLSLSSSSKKTTVLFPHYDQTQLQHYFTSVGIKPKPKSIILCCNSLILRGNFLVSKLFLVLSHITIPTIECPLLNRIILHYQNVECIGFDLLTQKLKILSPLNKCCSCVSILSNITQLNQKKITLLYKTKVFLLCSPKMNKNPPRSKSRTTNQKRLFGSKSPNKGLYLLSDDTSSSSSDLDDDIKQYIYHSDV
ncbi:hypothetical protein CL6EHI_079200 [Entamoeba histolytica]|uniref:Uncharacterized protein n=5 Tax=Entamoeba histolytica TaxID=5759 RepID=C4M7R4_ENTH1|nr:hypothetical protein EHI_079200 [Entamoeba histolytica HM-1:IMSS]EAL49531.2 hypothetical protein EHI_079200 [Entamoeba histolytica HM-1:IMSS]EMD42603.1 Hypothetical protein EHI5A_098710 [Entamoeba histolytica KU27]ENY61715.1 hypothetical protein EHI7A_061460 [Entamoeba histolytica HM-1:IMSS-A]GAT97593.1 hypothetical protein CL6EHI_079200 [Entamoeba histolytica]|eukprot:XP_654918.2 hypothetical protein EHI_079200 [Entamoeba histolytica HM-1:IMSS]